MTHLKKPVKASLKLEVERYPSTHLLNASQARSLPFFRVECA